MQTYPLVVDLYTSTFVHICFLVIGYSCSWASICFRPNYKHIKTVFGTDELAYYHTVMIDLSLKIVSKATKQRKIFRPIHNIKIDKHRCDLENADLVIKPKIWILPGFSNLKLKYIYGTLDTCLEPLTAISFS